MLVTFQNLKLKHQQIRMVEAVNNRVRKVKCEICENRVRKWDKEGNLLRAVFRCGHALCTDCMKKYTAANIILAYFPLQCPHEGCPGKINP